MQHVFIDVEAYGPPGMGRPFALGAVKFNTKRGVYARFQETLRWEHLDADPDTLSWLFKQSSAVVAQAFNSTDSSSFLKAWYRFMGFLYGSASALPSPTTFYADDWSDFAWLDFEARTAELTPLRKLGTQVDTSMILSLSGPVTRDLSLYQGVSELVPHVAVDDATSGALDYLAALKALNLRLPWEDGSETESVSQNI